VEKRMGQALAELRDRLGAWLPGREGKERGRKTPV